MVSNPEGLRQNAVLAPSGPLRDTAGWPRGEHILVRPRESDHRLTR